MKIMQLVFGLILALCSAVALAQAIDLNTASAEQLEKALKGIGPKKAADIVKYREANGPFKSVDDLTNVPGIKGKTLEKIKPLVSVGGAPSMPTAPAMPTTPTTPAMPTAAMPKAPTTPSMPTAPAMPKTPTTPSMPTAPAMPDKQTMPAMPDTPATSTTATPKP